MTARAKAVCPSAENIGLSDQLIANLQAECCDAVHWASPPRAQAEALSAFKGAFKGHYYSVQLRRCCYCSIELQPSKRTYELEHVLARSKYVRFMFEARNLAASCGLCNGSKRAKDVLVDNLLGAELNEIPFESVDYAIVHPHLDEWTDHLEFDDLGRIRSCGPKGERTIETCGIKKLNAIRTADYFGPAHRGSAEKLLRKFISLKQAWRKRQLIGLLKDLARQSRNETAIVLVERLEMDSGLAEVIP